MSPINSSPPADAVLVSGASRRALISGSPEIVPAGPVVLQLERVPDVESVRLDGRSLGVAFDPVSHSATVAINLARSTGYHHLQVGQDRTYEFGTQDAKLRINGVVEMLAFLRTHADALGLSWQGTIQFSGSGQILRDARLDAAWLERHLPEIAAITSSISNRPFVVTNRVRERAISGVPDVAATATLVRRDPSILELDPSGSLEFDGQTWSVREMVRRRSEATADTQGNRRITRLLLAVAELARRCKQLAPEELGPEFEGHLTTVSAALRKEPFARIRRRHGHLRVAVAPAKEERLDERYRRGRHLLNDLLKERSWDPENDVTEEWAFAGLADQVYQAFCAIVVARAFGLDPAAPLTTPGPHFESEDYQLWVDAVPPKTVLPNWRSETEVPADQRPDLLLRRTSDDQVAILDAKYRLAGERATSDSLTEVQLYLQAFGARQVSVLYPHAAAKPREITNEVFSITELPVAPRKDLDDYMTDVLRPAIESTFHAVDPVRKEEVDSAEREKQTRVVQAAAVRSLQADGEVVRLTNPNAMLAPENSLRRLLAEHWDNLGNDIQKMLITAEYFGDQVPVGFDHSGPVLGLFAACERLATDRMFAPSRSELGPLFERMTFGGAAQSMKRLPVWRTGKERALREWLEDRGGADIDALGRLGKVMQRVNKWRIAAAHAVLVDKETWDRTHTIVLGEGSGLLIQLDEALPK
jgi:hypothetical protein